MKTSKNKNIVIFSIYFSSTNHFRIPNDFKYERIADYLPNFSESFPWSSRCREGLELTLKLRTPENRGDIFFSEAFIIHPPEDSPLFVAMENIFQIEPGKLYEVFITPEVMTIDEDLKALDYEERSCLIDGEKELRFFKVYSKHNCEVECLSNRLKSTCGCVPVDVIRDVETPVCGFSQVDCINEVKYELKFLKNEANDSCKCFLPCDSIAYNYKIIETKFTEK